MSRAARPSAPVLAGRGGALALLLFGAVMIGWTAPLVRLSDAGPAATGFWRLALSLPLLALFALRAGARGEADAQADRSAWLAALGCGVFFALDLGFWHYGIHNTGVAKATLLSNLQPLVVTLVAWLLFRERPSLLFAAALLLAMAGVTVVGLTRGGVAAPGADETLGDLLSIGTAVWYSGYFLLVRRARDSLPTATVMAVTGAVGAAPLLLAAWLLGETLLPQTAGGWAAVAGLAAVHIVGQGAIAAALGRLPTATAAVVVLIQPVVTAVIGLLLFAEPIGPGLIVGGALVLGGVALAQLAPVRRSDAAPA